MDRQYTFKYCSPTRSSFLSGRLPYHVLQSTNYVDPGFSMMPAKLQQVGYPKPSFKPNFRPNPQK